MNKRKKNSAEPLDKVSENQPSDRIAELERKVTKLQKDVVMLKRLSGWTLWVDEGNEIEEKKKPGPKEKISDEELFQYRDALILWLEPVWPWMIDRLLAAGTVAGVEAILEAVAEEPERRPAWQERILRNAAALFEFLWDERFRKTLPKASVTDALTSWKHERRRRAANQLPTRQIANAMAGVPDITWRTSLDRCTAQPSTAFIALNLDMYYRELFGIPAPKDRDITGLSCPVPKSLQTILASPNEGTPQGVEPQTKAKRHGTENT
jgi:hypothetical protein